MMDVNGQSLSLLIFPLKSGTVFTLIIVPGRPVE